jgi:hypothetical protein
MKYSTIKFCIVICMFFSSLGYSKPGDWTVYTRNGNVNQILPVQNGTWVATQGGLFQVKSDLSTQKFTSKDGLGGNSIMGVFQSLDQKIWSITKSGVIARNDNLDAAFNIVHRSYLGFEDSLIPSGVYFKENYAIMAFNRHLCFFKVAELRSELCLDRLGNEDLVQNQVKRIFWMNNRIYVKTNKTLWSLLVNTQFLDSSRDEANKKINIADPQAWKIVQDTSILNSRDTLGLIQYKNEVFKQFTAQAKDDQNVYWLGLKNRLFKVNAGLTQEILLSGLPVNDDPFYGITMHPQGFPLLLNFRNVYKLKSNAWEFATRFSHTSSNELFGQYNDQLKLRYNGFTTNSRGDVFSITYGGGLLASQDTTGFGDYKSTQQMNYSPFDLESNPDLCMDKTINDGYTVVSDVITSNTSPYNLVSWWGNIPSKNNYGLGVIDQNRKLHCLNDIGGDMNSSGLGFANPENTEFFVSQPNGIDLWRFFPNEDNFATKIKTYSLGNIGSSRSFVVDRSSRVWIQGLNSIGLMCRKGADNGLCKNVENSDSIINVNAMLGIPAATISGLVKDKNDNIWVGTEGQGVYLIQTDDVLSNAKRITNYREEDGLANNNVRDLVADTLSGFIWFVHDQSVSALSTTARVIVDKTVKGTGFQVYPNPFIKSKHNKIFMDGLLEGAEIVVYTRSFQEVKRFQPNEIRGGFLEWDGKSRSDSDLTSGIYYIAVQNKKNVQRSKLIIVE